ncbi:MAG: metallophosphoesterase [Pseudomonadales bacterium]|nr:metallophosphoesterase [Pseudomonadales bacterium]
MIDAATLPSASDGEFRFAHLSDPHLTSLSGVRPGTLRDKRLLGWLSWRRKRRRRHDPAVLAGLVEDARAEGIEHWAITGDLTHIGHPQELAAARAWLASLGPPDAVSTIPGNHDLYVADPAGQMHASWAPWMCSDDDRPGFPWLRLRGPVALIGLDSAWAAGWLMATGELGAAQRTLLDGLLDATARAGYLRIVLIHHAPLPGLDPWRKRLVDADALATILEQRGAELVLHGHGHALRMHRAEVGVRALPILQAPSASATAGTGDHRAAWLDCRARRQGSSGRIEVLARAPGETLAHHVFESSVG